MATQIANPIREKKIINIKASREVILSAGTVGSPQLLMLSGIGPKKHLEELGIPVVADLPVGDNLQDHLFVPIGYECKLPVSYDSNRIGTLTNLIKWFLFRKGPFGSQALESCAFVKSLPSKNIPDVQIHFLCRGGKSKGKEEEELFVKSTGLSLIEDPPLYGFTLLPTLLYPKSRGTIRLKSKDPLDHPIIDPHYLEDREDMETLLRGSELCYQLINQSAFNKYRGRPAYSLPNMKQKFGTKEYLEEEIRRRVINVYHYVGTCKMGVDDTAVVTPDLKVRGIKGLRVIDASIMPTIVGSNTHAPSVMIGEKGSDLIKADYK